MSSRHDGILLVDKPEGPTSAGVVRAVKRALDVRKVGHLGTLDPFASGLLPLCIGEGSKVVPFLNQADKSYTGRIRLGARTDSLDRTGEVVEEAAVPELDAERLRSAASAFLGEIEQIPPMHSAIKRDGVPLYRLAHQGIEVPRPPRQVRIDTLDLVLADPTGIDFEMHCSKGTYVRSLARDLGEALGTVAHLEVLRRTRHGAYTVDESVSLDGLSGEPGAALLTPREALRGVAEREISPEVESALRLGQQWVLRDLASGEGLLKLVSDANGALVAVVEAAGAGWQLRRVFAANV